MSFVEEVEYSNIVGLTMKFHKLNCPLGKVDSKLEQRCQDRSSAALDT